MENKEWKKLLHENSIVNEASKVSPLETLKNIVKNHQWDYIHFEKGGKMKMDAQTANMLMTVYNALKGNSAKEKFEKMLGTNKASLVRLVDFGWSAIK